MLASTGQISCAMPNTHDAVCIQHNSKWPYNVQTCEITYGSWSYVGNEVNLKLVGKGYSTKQFEANNEWALNNVTIQYNAGKYNCCPDDEFPTIRVEFTLAHHSDVHVATMVAPAIGKFYGEAFGITNNCCKTLALMVINLVSALINPLKPSRVFLNGVNIFFHICYLQVLVEHIYANGDECPLISKYGVVLGNEAAQDSES